MYEGKTFSIVVPLDAGLLRAYSKFLLDMADDLGGYVSPDKEVLVQKSPAMPITEIPVAEANPDETPAPPVADETPLTPDPSVFGATPEPPTGAETPAPPTELPATTGEVDPRGMPWDARIHASTKTTLKNGNWKNRKGVDATERAQIEAHLLTGQPAPTTEAPAAEIATMPEFMVFIQSITADLLSAALASVGLTSIALVGARLDVLPALVKYIGDNK